MQGSPTTPVLHDAQPGVQLLRKLAFLGILAGVVASPAVSFGFDTGVSDDRVSLPEGPGSLEGIGDNVSVDPNMGLMRHAVPLLVPQGFAGVTPELSFGYSSGGGSTMLGMGWNLALPSVSRMTMRGVPRYDESDLFVANGGNELVRISEQVDAGQPAIYRARFESSFSRYLWHDRDGGAGGYWEVQYADGRVGFFGATADGQIAPDAIEASGNQTFKYHLVEMVDVYDHRMRMRYVKDGNLSLISSIDYVFTAGQPIYRLQFSYEARPDAVSDAKASFDRILTQRMTGVVVTVRGQRLRRYALSYDSEAESGRRSRLRTIESFGSTDERYPVVHSFSYSRGLGAQCDNVDCGQPFLTDMTNGNGLGVTFQSGQANLVDINGDALPDLIDASSTQPRHRFFINQLASDGTHTFSEASVSRTGEVSAFPLGSPRVQFLDVNGDGFTDLLNGGVSDQKVMLNRGNGDWSAVQDLAGSAVWNGADAELRFMDYDNDMDVDLIRSTATQTFVFENDGNFNFTRRDLAPLGTAFSESIQFTDMNGDGLLDIVQLQANVLRFKTNFGRGRFSNDFTTIAHPFSGADVSLALLEDLDSDGFADIVVVTGNSVRYVLNRNGEAFEPLQTLSEAGGQSLPNRESTTTVLAADMNGNGSIDITWISATGAVQYLDLFPVRSHLLTRIENGLGRVTDIVYQPSVQQRARSAEEGQPWVNPLPYPMAVVAQTDEFDLLTNLHDVTDFRYRDGFYDGVERQFRGYTEVEQISASDDSQAAGRIVSRFDVGQSEPHLNGQLLFERSESDGAVIREAVHTYGNADECPIAEVPDNAALAARGLRAMGFACKVATETTVQEGLSSDRHVTTRSLMVYGDGYGNVTRTVEQGVVAVGGGACEACQNADSFGAPCGNQCRGDESVVKRSFVPNTNTGGRWLLNKVASEQRFGTEDDSGLFAEEIFHYDGEDFVGLASGQLTQGKLSRVVSRVDETKTIETRRQAFDVHGNAVQTLDPLGVPGGTTHRRQYTYDADGLRVVQTDIFNESPDGTAYRLRRSYQYDELFDKVVLSSSWMRVEGDVAQTAPDPTAYTYDAFGRVDSILLPGGDSGASPTTVMEYDLGNPNTRLITRRRSRVGGPLDLETIRCVDGRGRTYQTRTKVADGRYLVDGFTKFNLRSQPVEVFQSYEAQTDACDIEVPSGVRSTRYRYDGTNRRIELVLPDGSVQRVAYEPLRTLRFDGEDTDANSLHFDTPTVETVDGLGRLVARERRLTDAQAVTILEYDALGHPAGYVDAEGNRKSQTHDALGRLLAVDDPNAGPTSFVYDDASQMIERTDARGVTTAFGYDGLNRETERFDPANREASLISTEWDVSANCEPARCPNTTGNMVMRSYPGGADFKGYDVRRRPFSTVRVIEGQTYELTTRFDNADRTLQRTYPDGRTLSLAYDAASRVVQIPGVLARVSHTPQGLAETWERENGVIDRFGYDERLRLVGVDVQAGSEVLQAISLDLDRASNVKSALDAAPGALLPSASYTHDAWYRTTQVAHGRRIEDMSFSLIDSMLTRGEVSYQYNDRPGAPSAMGDEAMRYDEAGCVIEAGGFTHTWDFMGRLVKSEGADNAVRSVYGPQHLRIAQHNGRQLTHYVADDFEVRDGMSIIYARIGRDRIARLESSAFAATWLGAPEAEVNAGSAYLRGIEGADSADRWLTAAAHKMLVDARPATVALHKNHLGSLTLATGDGGEIIGRRAYQEFGSISASEGYVDRYGFTGQEHEPHTQLIRFAHRFLSTDTGQWLSPDPAFRAIGTDTQARLPEAIARYSYVLNNPSTFVDPDGLKRFSGVRKFFGKIFGRKKGPSLSTVNPRFGERRRNNNNGNGRLLSMRRRFSRGSRQDSRASLNSAGSRDRSSSVDSRSSIDIDALINAPPTGLPNVLQRQPSILSISSLPSVLAPSGRSLPSVNSGSSNNSRSSQSFQPKPANRRGGYYSKMMSIIMDPSGAGLDI